MRCWKWTDKAWIYLTAGALLACMLASCGTPRSVPSTAAATPVLDTTEAVDVENAEEPVPFPLSEPGPYYTGKCTFTVEDASRDGQEVGVGRKIGVTLFYPALRPEDSADLKLLAGINRDPDLSGAPYPLILTGGNSGSYLFKSHLASHGFIMAIVRSPGFSYTAPWNNSVIDAPLDFLFVLDMLTSNPPKGLDDVLDTNRVGVAGYSSDGLFSLALGGARINPEYYFSQCAQAPSMDPPPSTIGVGYFCKLSEKWDEFSSQVGAEISTDSEGLWQPTTDDRILAIMPMAPDSAWLYGAEGLAAINIPSLSIAGTADKLVSYELSSCYIYEHLVNSERILISFIGKKHMMVENKEIISRINHFAVAFFGTYLQGKSEYRDYFSEEFVSQFDDLAWGVYQGE